MHLSAFLSRSMVDFMSYFIAAGTNIMNERMNDLLMELAFLGPPCMCAYASYQTVTGKPVV